MVSYVTWFDQANDRAPEKNKTAVNPVTPRLSNGRPGDIVKAHMRDCSENTLHVAPDIPAKKLANAMAKYMPNVRETDVLLLYDNTVWGGAKDGMSLTSDTLYWHAPFVSSGSISYDDIVTVSTNFFSCLPSKSINILFLKIK